MNPLHRIAAIGCALLVLGQPAYAERDETPVKKKEASMAVKVMTEAQFREVAVGKLLSDRGFKATLHPDNTFSGTSRGETVEGTWSWEDGRYCREGTADGKPFAKSCRDIEVDGDRLTFIRDSGKRTTLRIKAQQFG